MKILQGRVTQQDRAERAYLYLPFTVPAGTTRIDLRYQFEEEASILDLGVFDPELAPFPARTGFRGWSGSARRSVFIAMDDATPGYIPGPLPAGTWHVVLGLARVAAAGCDYQVEITFDSAPRAVIEPFEPAVFAGEPEHRWYAGDLQSHTFHSDAKGSPEDLLRAALDRDLEFLAVTDHNTWSHHRALAELTSAELLLIPGQEVTTYRGHANVWGVHGWVDFGIEHDADLDQLVGDVHDRGGLFSINHPKSTSNCIGCDWEYPVPAHADSFEAWQGPWANRNWESLDRYDQLLRQGRRLTLVGGSNRHQPGYPDPDAQFLQVGSPTTWLELDELSVPAVLSAIRAGRAFVSESPDGPELELNVDGVPMGGVLAGYGNVTAQARVQGAAGDILRWIGSSGVLRELFIQGNDFTDTWVWQPRGQYLRIEVIAAASLPRMESLLRSFGAGLPADEVMAHPWRRALSNPVYLE